MGWTANLIQYLITFWCRTEAAQCSSMQVTFSGLQALNINIDVDKIDISKRVGSQEMRWSYVAQLHELDDDSHTVQGKSACIEQAKSS